MNLARFIAAALAHNASSVLLTVTLVGFGAEMTQINPDRITHTENADQAITALHAQLRSVTETLAAAEVDVLSGAAGRGRGHVVPARDADRLANHDAEVDEDLPPRTAAMLFRRERQQTG